MFDPYHKWLGISETSRPPTYYQLLGIAPTERDPDVIEAAAVRQSAYVRNFLSGEYVEHAARILNEIAEARLVLLDPQKRAAYDAQLRQRQPAGSATSRPVVPATPAMPTGVAVPLVQPLQIPVPAAVPHSGTFGQSSSPARFGPVYPQAAQPQGTPSLGQPYPASSPGAIGAAPHAAAAAVTPIVLSGPGGGSPQRLGHHPGQPVQAAVIRAVMPTTTPLGPSNASDPLAALDAAIPPADPLALSPRQVSPMVVLSIIGGLAVLLVIVGMVTLSIVNRVRRPAGPAVASGQGPASSATAVEQNSGPAAKDVGSTPANDFNSADPLDMPAPAGSYQTQAGPGGQGNMPPGGGSQQTQGTSQSPLGGPSAPMGVGSQTGADNNTGGQQTPSSGENGAAKPVRWGGSPPTNEFEPDWDAPNALAISLEREDLVVYARTAPLVFVKDQVYDMQSGQPKFNTPVTTGKAAAPIWREAALSAEGTLLAVSLGDFGEHAEVYDCRTGTVFRQVQPDKAGKKIMYLAFPSENELLVCLEGGGGLIQLWELSSRKKTREMPCEEFDGYRADLHPDGQHLAVPVAGGAIVYNFRSRRVAARAVVPNASEKPDGVRFSTDGQELVAVLNKGKRLVCWNSRAEVVLDQRLDIPTYVGTYFAPPIEWVPDGSGWLINGHYLVHRASGRLVWRMEPSPLRAEAGHRFVGNDKLAVVHGRTGMNELRVIDIPMRQINESAAAMQRGDPAYLSPQRPLSLVVEVAEAARANREQVAFDLRTQLTARLQEQGLAVAAGQPMILSVQYNERQTTAQVQRVRTRRIGPFGPPIHIPDFPFGPAEVYNVPAIDISISVSLGPEGLSPVWSDTGSLQLIGENGALPTPEQIRQTVGNLFGQMGMPYFVPEDSNLLCLPLETKL